MKKLSLALLGLSALVLAGCGGSADDAAEQAPPPIREKAVYTLDFGTSQHRQYSGFDVYLDEGLEVICFSRYRQFGCVPFADVNQEKLAEYRARAVPLAATDN